MQELRFDCPQPLAQRFWAMCRERGETPGAMLRILMSESIADHDPAFVMPDVQDLRDGGRPYPPEKLRETMKKQVLR